MKLRTTAAVLLVALATVIHAGGSEPAADEALGMELVRLAQHDTPVLEKPGRVAVVDGLSDGIQGTVNAGPQAAISQRRAISATRAW